MNATSDPVQLGETIAGKYRIELVLGRGGMGVVMVATHLLLQQRVALKFLRRDMRNGPVVIARFLREAQALATLRSPHVVRVMDVATLDSGEPYFVMELLEGTDLRKVLALRGRLPISEAVSYVLQACEAVAEAHSKGIVHRDLKPSNLFLSPQGDGSQHLKVLDFGVSKVTSNASDPAIDNHSITDTGELLGSPKYMAPEQIRGAKGLEPRTDIWALGAILYELISGRAPFVGDTMAAVLASVAADAPPKLRELQRDIPVALESAVLRCLQKQVDLRFASVSELAAALAPFSESGPEVAARIERKFGSGVTVSSSVKQGTVRAQTAVPADRREATGTFRSVFGEQPTTETRRRVWRVFGVVAAGALVTAAAFWARYDHGPTPLSNPSAQAKGHDGTPLSEHTAAAPSFTNVPLAVTSSEVSASLPSSRRPVRPIASVAGSPLNGTAAPAGPRTPTQSKASARARSSPAASKNRLGHVFADGTLDRK